MDLMFEPIVVVVLKKNGLKEILWSLTTKANLNYYLSHGSSRVIDTFSMMHRTRLIFILCEKACKKDIGGVLGVKDSMLAHILGKGGNNPCPIASAEARKTARKLKEPKEKAKRERETSGSEIGRASCRERVCNGV